MKEYNLQMFAFKATESIELCKEFINGHEKFLELSKVGNISSANKNWILNDSVYVIVVYDNTSGKMVGGIRLDMKTTKVKLPAEEAILELDSNGKNYFDRLYKNFDYTGEMCALWIDEFYRNIGLGLLLLISNMSLAKIIGSQLLIFLCSEDTLKMFLNLGCIIEKRLGRNGAFCYPRQDMTAYFLHSTDLLCFSKARTDLRKRILHRSAIPKETVIEEGKNSTLRVTYEFNLAKNKKYLEKKQISCSIID